jgi:translocation and assembly module TamA
LNKLLIIFFIAIWVCHMVTAQSYDKYNLYITDKDREKINESDMIALFRSEVKSIHEFDHFMYYFYEKGFLLASYQVQKPDSLTTRFLVTLGEPFRWAQLEQGNLPDEIFLKTGFKKNIFQDEIFNFNRITKLFRSVIQYSERHGFPFAGIRLKKIEIKGQRITACLDYQPGPPVYFGQLSSNRDVNLKPSFLAAYLNIRPGMFLTREKSTRYPTG